MKFKKKSVFIAAGSLTAITLGILVTGSFYFYNVAIKRNPKDFLNNNPDLAHTQGNSDSIQTLNVAGKEPQPPRDNTAKWVDSQSFETWNMTSEDGLNLTGYYIPAKEATTKTVLLAHGYSSKGKDMGSFAKFYYEKLGYNVFMPDDRGHGASEGDYIGFGWPDRKDYLLWIQKIVDRVGDDAQIALHGISMGGATVMMLSGEDLSKQVKVIIEDCGYTSVKDQLEYQLKRLYNLPSFPILNSTSLLTKIRAGYGFNEASALKQVEKNKTPMLFIHGDSDTFVPSEMVWKVYNACRAEKDIFIVKGAGHGMAYATDKPAYEKKVSEFIGGFIK